MGSTNPSFYGEFSSDLVRFKVLRAYFLSKAVTVFNSTISIYAQITVSLGEGFIFIRKEFKKGYT